MENKLNFSAIDTYAKAYSEKICDELYRNKERVNGDDLLNLKVEQVGLFVLNSIYSTWQSEADNLKSPYFDYEAEDVQASMKKLMNVLSKNISVERDNLEPLVQQSVKDTVLLTVSPYSYFKNLISNLSSAADFTLINRFIKINGGLGDELQKSIDNNGDTSIIDRFDHVFDDIDIAPDNAKVIFDKFSELYETSAANFYLTMAAEDEEDDEVISADNSENTLNDKFVGSNYETVADQLKNHEVSKGSIKSMLSINQKFMFINDLFNDNQDDFNKVVDFIEGCDTKEAALSFISNNYLKHNIWNPNAPQVREFLRLIDLQFE